MKLVARHQLTHQLTLVTGAVSEECALVLKDVYTDDTGKIHALLVRVNN
jgi:cytochrome P450 monooxygenase-1